MPHSWRSEIQYTENGMWVGNAFRFATEDEAQTYASMMAIRHPMIYGIRVQESQLPANYRLDNEGRLLPIE